jgi:hypothetical protein
MPVEAEALFLAYILEISAAGKMMSKNRQPRISF